MKNNYLKKNTNNTLNMKEDVTRRDFLNGISIAIGSSILPAELTANYGSQDLHEYYPPMLQGMRGSHPGSFEIGHLARDGGNWEGIFTGESFDLIVVGGGISGLAAAYYYRQSAGPSARILILDNHDDFGGHAKRNEFSFQNKKLIGYGGTMLIEAPSGYPKQAKKLIKDLGINSEKFYQYFDRNFHKSFNLKRATFFDRETFGKDYLAVGNLDKNSVLSRLPLNKKSKTDLKRLLDDEVHYLHDVPESKRIELLNKIDYLTYLRDYGKFSQEVLDLVQPYPRGVWAINADAYPAFYAWYSEYPGFGDLDLGLNDYEENSSTQEEPQIFHFPDGNATIARMLVRNLIPHAAPGSNMEDIVTSQFDYSQLDDPNWNTQIRLNSIAVRAIHKDNKLNNPVHVTYVRDGKAHVIEGKKVIMAGYNALIPNLCPELPSKQKIALKNCIRAPLVYTNVLVKNWKSFAKLGVHRISCPGLYHSTVRLDFPVSIGDYKFSESPNEPIILQLVRVPGQPGNPSAREQFLAGQRDLLTTPFEVFERKIREDLDRVLGEGGFDANRDIAGITVNRWPHGYAYTYNPDEDSIAWEPSLWPKNIRFWEKARKPFGNIAIAGTDAASNAMTEAAIEQAYRAIKELE